MIFSTLAEAQAVENAISERKTFDDLTDGQNNCIRGMYWAIEAVENAKAIKEPIADIDGLNKLFRPVLDHAYDDAIDNIESNIADMVVAFRDNNATEDMDD